MANATNHLKMYTFFQGQRVKGKKLYELCWPIIDERKHRIPLKMFLFCPNFSAGWMDMVKVLYHVRMYQKWYLGNNITIIINFSEF